jgi:hypothetical protein
MANTERGVNISCMECERRIHLDFRPKAGHIVTCPTCETEMEITSSKPLRIDLYYEDWEGLGDEENWEEAEE